MATIRREDIKAIIDGIKTISSLKQTIEELILPMVKKHDRMLTGENGDNGLKSDVSKLDNWIHSLQNEMTEHKGISVKCREGIYDLIESKFKELTNNKYKHFGSIIQLITIIFAGISLFISLHRG